MSSILEALRKVEAREERRPIRLPPPPPRSRARLAALVAAAAFVAGAAAVALVIAFRPSAPPEPVAPAETKVASVTPPAEPAAETPPAPPAAAAVPPPPAATAAAPQTARPHAPATVPPDEAVQAAGDEADSDVPEQITILRPTPAAPPEAEVPEAEVQVEALLAPAPAAPAVEVLPGPPQGAPDIHVSFLIYSPVPERRVVSMTINNGPLVTLHEGQRSGDISLVRILRDRIHVDHNGRIYSVRAVL